MSKIAVTGTRTRRAGYINVATGWITCGLVLVISAAALPQIAGGGAEPVLVSSAMPIGSPVDGLAPHQEMTAASCETCHHFDATLSHPTGVPAGMNIPHNLPLDNGRITCISCHQNTEAAHDQARQTHNPMLRTGAPGPAFCLQCHDLGDSGSRMEHAIYAGRAHLGDKDSSRWISSIGSLSSILDDESQQCMGCHDGSQGMALGVSHPIGIAYDDMASLSKPLPRHMIQRHLLDPRIRLFNGNLGCGSCHSTYSGEDKMVVMENDQSQLCVSCHAMR